MEGVFDVVTPPSLQGVVVGSLIGMRTILHIEQGEAQKNIKKSVVVFCFFC